MAVFRPIEVSQGLSLLSRLLVDDHVRGILQQPENEAALDGLKRAALRFSDKANDSAMEAEPKSETFHFGNFRSENADTAHRHTEVQVYVHPLSALHFDDFASPTGGGLFRVTERSP